MIYLILSRYLNSDESHIATVCFISLTIKKKAENTMISLSNWINSTLTSVGLGLLEAKIWGFIIA